MMHITTTYIAGIIITTATAKVGKIGAAYNNASLISLISDASWAYNWGDTPGGPVPPGVDYCPMLWGPQMYDNWSLVSKQAISSGSTCVLGFNEPDMISQSNMSPWEAAIGYQTYITPLAGQATLVSPAITNGAGKNIGFEWMKSWLQACNGSCKPNVMAVHYYADTSITDFYDFINNASRLANENGMNSVWVTEFQNTGSISSQVSFLQEAIPWLNNNAAVGRYAYFFTAEGYLLSDGMLNAVGQVYTATYGNSLNAHCLDKE